MPLTVVMLGASGAVGGHVLETLRAAGDLERLTLLVRRPLTGSVETPITQHVVDVLDPATYRVLLSGHRAAICTLGMGQVSKASPKEFVRIDKDAVLAFATACKAAGVEHFELLSSVDANPQSRIFYLRVKGKLEDGLKAIGFQRLSLFRPSNILTPVNRYGWTQALILAIWPKLDPILFGRWRRYRGVRVATLGAAISRNLSVPGRGMEILQWDQFIALANDREN